MSTLAEVIAAALDPDWDHRLERELFGSDVADAIGEVVGRFCADSLGSAVAHGRFYRASVGAVFGVELVDGRSVVVKVNRKEHAARLGEAQVVQRHLALHGFPVPWPLRAPAPLAFGVVTAETLLERGTLADGHDPEVRAALASSLHDLHERCRTLVGSVSLHEVWGSGLPPGQLWPDPPHDLRFDFAATTSGAEWIDELATIARRRLVNAAGERVITHVDWRVEHVRFDGAIVSTVYDCDSFAYALEPVAVGGTAFAFTADWSRPDPYPTLEESAEFVADYEGARGRPFDDRELDAVDAGHLYALAYGARCQHSDRVLELLDPGSSESFLALLEERGERWLVPG